MTLHDHDRAYWCDMCQVPVLGPVCLACGAATRSIASSTLRPVFSAEIDYLANYFQTDFSRILRANETWVSPSNKVYFVAGKPVFKLSGSPKDMLAFSYKVLFAEQPQIPDRSTFEMHKSLREANSQYVMEIQYEAENFIRQTIDTHKSRMVIVSFSGGKDSLVVSNLVMNALGRSDILHVFADTTIEAPDTYTYIESFKKAHSLTPMIYCKSTLDFFEVAKEIGAPSRILRWCCTTHKTNPLSKIVSVLNSSGGVLAFDGVRKRESNRRSNYKRTSCNHKVAKEILASPILEWSDIQLWIYMLYHGLSLNTAYEKGFRRVGCLYCPFNSPWSELLIKHYYPEKYSQWTSFLYQHAEQIRHIDPENYVHQGWRVRAGGRGLDSYKTVLDSYPCAISEDAVIYQLVSGNARDVEIYLRPFGDQILVHQDNYSKTFMIREPRTCKMLVSVEISYEDNTLRIAYLTTKNKLLLRKRIEKQLKKLQSCIKCGACMAKCPVEVNRFVDTAILESDFCINCLKCVSFHCPVVDSLTKKGKG
jgi:phosphoadenosine phosphosulfate reductase